MGSASATGGEALVAARQPRWSVECGPSVVCVGSRRHAGRRSCWSAAGGPSCGRAAVLLSAWDACACRERREERSEAGSRVEESREDRKGDERRELEGAEAIPCCVAVAVCGAVRAQRSEISDARSRPRNHMQNKYISHPHQGHMTKIPSLRLRRARAACPYPYPRRRPSKSSRNTKKA